MEQQTGMRARSSRVRALLLTLALSVAVTAAAAESMAEVEIRVQDFSFSDGPSDRPKIAIEAQDIKGSELLTAAAKSGVHTKKPLSAASTASAPSPSRSMIYQEPNKKVDRVIPVAPASSRQRNARDNDADGAATASSRSTAASTVHTKPSAIEQLTSEIDTTMLELSQQEQVIVLVVVICGLCVVALVLVSTWNLVRFVWQYVQEQRALRRLFLETDPTRLSVKIGKYPATPVLLIRTVAVVRLHHLEFVCAAAQTDKDLAALSFDKAALVLSGMPKRVDDAENEMTLLDVEAKLKQLLATGDFVGKEIMSVSSRVPARWKRYVNTNAWQMQHDAWIQKLPKHIAKVEQLTVQISDLLVSKLDDGEAIEKGKLVHLLSAVRQSSPPHSEENGGHFNDGSTSMSMSMSGSMSMSASMMGSAGGKDEFSFFVKAFDEINEQQKVKQELQEAMQGFSSTSSSTRTTKLEAASTAETSSPEPVNGPHSSKLSSESDHEKVLLKRRLEKFVDHAEMLEVTHFVEVERAQDELEKARRENFCAEISNKDAKVLETVESLALKLVSIGAERKDAVLKASGILANQSNTMRLEKTIRDMFDMLREQDIKKMNERRKRDAAKLLDKRERMGEMFRLKQQLVVQKLELKRQAQQQKEEDERRKQAQQEQDEWRRHMVRERQKFVWLVTKVDLLIVLLVMGLVFFESLRQLAFMKPVCQQEDTSKLSGMLSLFGATNSLAVLGCQVAYGAKMAAILLVLALVLFLLSQLNLLVVVVPVAMALALYYVRTEWLNMLFRVPLVAVVYGFNSTCLYLLNRSEEEGGSTRSEPASATESSSSSKKHALIAYLVFPILSIALSVLVGIGIACDDPQQCAVTAYNTATPVVRGLAELAREAYGL